VTGRHPDTPDIAQGLPTLPPTRTLPAFWLLRQWAISGVRVPFRTARDCPPMKCARTGLACSTSYMAKGCRCRECSTWAKDRHGRQRGARAVPVPSPAPKPVRAGSTVPVVTRFAEASPPPAPLRPPATSGRQRTDAPPTSRVSGEPPGPRKPAVLDCCMGCVPVPAGARVGNRVPCPACGTVGRVVSFPRRVPAPKPDPEALPTSSAPRKQRPRRPLPGLEPYRPGAALLSVLFGRQ